jgi:hypothetical protein
LFAHVFDDVHGTLTAGANLGSGLDHHITARQMLRQSADVARRQLRSRCTGPARLLANSIIVCRVRCIAEHDIVEINGAPNRILTSSLG